MDEITPIGKGEVLLHVGLHKTGTTALQVALADARPILPEHGVRYPGNRTYQHKAVLAGARRSYGWQDRGGSVPPRKHWKRLLKEAKWSGRTIVSSEFMDDIKPEAGAKIIEALGGVSKVHVVVTLRAIGSILPSAWQQHVKSGMTLTYSQWLKAILRDEPTPRSERFWWRHDQVKQVQRWADLIGTDRTHVVIIPEGDRDAIFTAFEGLLALPAGLLAQRQGLIQNRSMTAAEAELVRRLNIELTSDMSWDEFNSLVRRGLVLNMVENRRPAPDEEKLATPKWAAQRAQELGQEFADGVAALGVNVIGDPAALAVLARSGSTSKPEALAMDAAVAGLKGVLLESLQERRKLAEIAAVPSSEHSPRRRWTARGVAKALKRRATS